MEWAFFWPDERLGLVIEVVTLIGESATSFSIYHLSKNGSVEWAPRLLLSFGAVPQQKLFRRHLICGTEQLAGYFVNLHWNDRKCWMHKHRQVNPANRHTPSTQKATITPSTCSIEFVLVNNYLLLAYNGIGWMRLLYILSAKVIQLCDWKTVTVKLRLELFLCTRACLWPEAPSRMHRYIALRCNWHMYIVWHLWNAISATKFIRLQWWLSNPFALLPTIHCCSMHSTARTHCLWSHLAQNGIHSYVRPNLSLTCCEQCLFPMKMFAIRIVGCHW